MLTLLRHEGTIGVLGRRVLKRDGVGILKSEVVPKNSGAAVEGKQGQRLRIAAKASSISWSLTRSYRCSRPLRENVRKAVIVR